MANGGHILDLRNHHFVRELGDLMLFGTWVGATMNESEPCLVIVPRFRNAAHTHIRPACIALSSAYKYDEPSYMLAAAREFNSGLGREDSMQCVHRIADIIHSHLGDLVSMPPRPVRSTFVGGEMRVRNRDTGKTEELEVKEDV